MDTKTISLLREWAKTYNTESFIKDDPVRFPHRFTEKRDIEISAFLTAWISYGRRAHILQKAEELHRLMGESPYEFIRTGETSFAPLRNRPVRRRDTFYRFYTYHDLHLLCCRLKDIYDTYDCMEDAMAAAGPCEDPILRLGLTGQKTATLRTAREITDALAKVFPDDPCLGDFALFGYDINQE